MARIETSLSGVTFAVKSTPALATARPLGKATVGLDPDNEYAKHTYGALPVEWLGIRVGFLPDGKPPTDEGAGPEDLEKWFVHETIGAFLAAGKPVECDIVDYAYIDGDEFNRNHVGELSAVSVALATDPAPYATRAKAQPKQGGGLVDLDPSISMTDFSDMGVKMDSFNEAGVAVSFEEKAHTYTYDGKIMAGVTGLIAKTYKPFEKDMVASRCEKSYGMKAKDIVRMWDMAGEITSGFGTAIHAAIEARQLFGDRATPKLDLLKTIVEEFPWEDGVEVFPEALITCVARGVCGMSDRVVVLPDGLVRIEDLKIQHGIEEESRYEKNLVFPELPQSKLGKATLQLSVYAEMIERAGRGVCNEVVVHAWDNGWTRHVLPRLPNVLDRLTGVES